MVIPKTHPNYPFAELWLRSIRDLLYMYALVHPAVLEGQDLTVEDVFLLAENTRSHFNTLYFVGQLLEERKSDEEYRKSAIWKNPKMRKVVKTHPSLKTVIKELYPDGRALAMTHEQLFSEWHYLGPKGSFKDDNIRRRYVKGWYCMATHYMMYLRGLFKNGCFHVGSDEGPAYRFSEWSDRLSWAGYDYWRFFCERKRMEKRELERELEYEKLMRDLSDDDSDVEDT